MAPPLHELARLAAGHHGVFTTAEATATGMTRRAVRTLVDKGWCERLAPGVYRVAGAPRTVRQGWAMALAVHGPAAVLSHESAAALWSFVGFRPGPPVLTLPVGANQRSRLATIHVSRSLPTGHLAHRERFPVTNVARTIADLAATLPPARLEVIVDDALAARRTTMAGLLTMAGERSGPGHGGSVALRKLLEDRSGSWVAPASELERRARRLWRAAGLPEPAYEVDVGDGTWIGRVDCLWQEQRVIVELDGRRFHGGPTARDADRRRDNQLHASGWVVLRFTWHDIVERPDEVVALVRRALERPGLPGHR